MEMSHFDTGGLDWIRSQLNRGVFHGKVRPGGD